MVIWHWFQIYFSEGENKQVQPEWRWGWPDPFWPVSLFHWEVWGATRQWRWRRWWQDWWSVKLCNLLMLFFSSNRFWGWQNVFVPSVFSFCLSKLGYLAQIFKLCQDSLYVRHAYSIINALLSWINLGPSLCLFFHYWLIVNIITSRTDRNQQLPLLPLRDALM